MQVTGTLFQGLGSLQLCFTWLCHLNISYRPPRCKMAAFRPAVVLWGKHAALSFSWMKSVCWCRVMPTQKALTKQYRVVWHKSWTRLNFCCNMTPPGKALCWPVRYMQVHIPARLLGNVNAIFIIYISHLRRIQTHKSVTKTGLPKSKFRS